MHIRNNPDEIGSPCPLQRGDWLKKSVCLLLIIRVAIGCFIRNEILLIRNSGKLKSLRASRQKECDIKSKAEEKSTDIKQALMLFFRIMFLISNIDLDANAADLTL